MRHITRLALSLVTACFLLSAEKGLVSSKSFEQLMSWKG
jgi:hypothetical protein